MCEKAGVPRRSPWRVAEEAGREATCCRESVAAEAGHAATAHHHEAREHRREAGAGRQRGEARCSGRCPKQQS
jgi:hypothetical protein